MAANDAQVRVAITAKDETTAVLRSVIGEVNNLGGVVSSVGSLLSGMAGGFGPGMFAGIASGAAELAKNAAEAGEQIYRMEQISGMGSMELSGLRALATESGESFEGLTGILAKFGKSIESAFTDPAGKAGKVLSSLFSEQEINSLKLAPMSQRLEEVAKKIFGLSDAATLDADAAAIFGRGWMANVETLKKFGEQGDKVAEMKAKIAGIGLSEEDVRQSREFLEVWKDINLSMTGVAETFGHMLIPAFNAGIEPLSRISEMLDLSEKYHGLKTISPADIGDDSTPKMQGALLNTSLPDYAKGMKVIPPKPAPPASPSAGGKGMSDDEKYITQELESFNRADKEAQDLFSQWTPTLTPVAKAWDDYYQRLKKVNELSSKLDVSPLQAESLEKLGEALDKAGNLPVARQSVDINAGQTRGAGMPTLETVATLGQVQSKLSNLDTLGYSFGKNMGAAFDQMIRNGQNFEAILERLAVTLIETALKVELFKPLAAAYGGKDGGFLGGFFSELAGGRAGGGDINYGDSVMVGEEGPEIFTPSVPGSITPHNAIQGGGGGNMTMNIDARGADAGVEYRAQRGAMVAMRQASVNGYLISREMAKRGA